MSWTRREALTMFAAAAITELPAGLTPRMPTAFVPHGGGPWPVLPLPYFTGAPETKALAGYMRSIATVCPRRPRALSALMSPSPRVREEADAFDAWLADAVARPAAERDAHLLRWFAAPAAQACHPREEHLIPLLVAAGAAGEDAGVAAWTGTMRGKRISAHHFGGAAPA